MEVLSIKKYNERQTAKWHQDYSKMMEEIRLGKRSWSELPQLAFYVFNKSYGYVAFGGHKALWDKTKKGVVAWWEHEEKLKKIRGW